MLLLALDTSTRHSSLALCSEDQLYGEYTWYSGNNHSVELLSNIQRIVAASAMTLSQLDAIAVATGPGSFNALRVALSTAKALSFALKKPLVGVSTLDVIAAQQQQEHRLVCSVLEASRSELYAACYLFDPLYSDDGELSYRLRRAGDYLLVKPEGVAAYIQEHGCAWQGLPEGQQPGPFLFCGEIGVASRQALRTCLPDSSLFVSNLQAARRASSLAELAFQYLHDGKEDDPVALEPLYLRRPSITTSTRKQPLLGGTAQQPARPHTTERGEGALRH